MEYFCGLDIATETTGLCVVDHEGTVVYQASVATDPEAIYRHLKPYLRNSDPISAKLLEEMKALEAMPDSSIDFSDAPEVLDCLVEFG